MGRFPLSSTEILSWFKGSGYPFEYQDFEDILHLSQAYCAACIEYDGVLSSSPFVVKLSEGERKALDEKTEAQLTRLFGSA